MDDTMNAIDRLDKVASAMHGLGILALSLDEVPEHDAVQLVSRIAASCGDEVQAVSRLLQEADEG